MKTTRPSFTKVRRRLFGRRRRTAHDPWLIFSIEMFNFEAGWSQLLAKQQAQQFGR